MKPLSILLASLLLTIGVFAQQGGGPQGPPVGVSDFIRLANGSAANPSIQFPTSGTGVYSTGTNVAVTVSGTLKFYADASNVNIQAPSGVLWSSDGGGSIGNPTAARPSGVFIQGPSITAGADATLVNAGEVRRIVYKATVTASTCNGAAGFIAASLNADCVIATFPAKTEVTRVIVDNTAGWTCSATCTGTKTTQLGKTAGGSEYLVAKDATVVATYGLANADLGAALTTSATTPVGGGDLPSFSATTTIKARWVSGTGNWGNASVTNVNAGSTTFYIETLVFP